MLVYGFDLCVWFDLVYGFDLCFVVLDKKLKPTMENKVISFKILDTITYNFSIHSHKKFFKSSFFFFFFLNKYFIAQITQPETGEKHKDRAWTHL